MGLMSLLDVENGTDGRHRINVSAPGFDGFSDDIEIGDTLTELDVAFTVVRLDQRVAVVHDHRFGECVGQLVASVTTPSRWRWTCWKSST